ncbi:MAG TPA: right-handed parallel beta-helix repeat-containing protein [Solirubrobacteraceae bacterium]|nr:right-handed parallel beta-helix repeat-containing protein [Solirubrobacteraceae bacterium]
MGYRRPGMPVPPRGALLSTLLVGVLALGLGPAPAAAKRFYVDPSGRDGASGRSPAHAWRTVHRVNRASLRPGDVVAFRAGRTFADDQLTPRRSGARGAPIAYRSYGGSAATLARGAWLASVSWISVARLRFHGTDQAIASGRGSGARHITVVRNLISDVDVAVNSANPADRAWRIAHNRIVRTGDSGIIAQGSSFTIAANEITRTGLDRGIPYDKHGIYSKSARARIVGNRITGFQAQGISTRFRDAVIEDNVVRDGGDGIGYWGDDPVAGTTTICGNTIAGVRYGVLIGGDGAAGQTQERFRILRNTITTTGGAGVYNAGGLPRVTAAGNRVRRTRGAQPARPGPRCHD